MCKFYLCGFCPYEEFRRTKNDCGECPAVHDDACRAQWAALDDREKERYGYERDLMRRVERHLSDLRRRIEVNTERLKETQPLYLADDQAAIDAMAKEIDDLLANAAKLGEEGDVDAAEAATAQADAVRERRAALERQADSRSGNNATRGLVQSVCPVSGLIINDEESRLRDHHSGRNYNSWKKLHDTHAALLETLRRRDEERRRDGGGGGSVSAYHHSDYLRRDRDREHRDRDHYPRSGRDRDRERDHDRHRDRGSDRHHRRRSRDRRRRSRSRSRSRDRRHGDRYRDRGREEFERKAREGEEKEPQGSPEEGEAPLEAYAAAAVAPPPAPAPAP